MEKGVYSLGRRQSSQLITRFDLMTVITTYANQSLFSFFFLLLFSFSFTKKEDKWQEQTSCVSQAFDTRDNITMTILQGNEIKLVEHFCIHWTQNKYPNSIYDMFNVYAINFFLNVHPNEICGQLFDSFGIWKPQVTHELINWSRSRRKTD